MNKMKIGQMTAISLLIAMQIILTRFGSIETPTLRIGFAFIPLAVCSIMYGPLIGGIAAAIADVVGFFIFPKGPFFPGFTLSAFLTGVTYGVLLHKKPNSIVNYIIAAFIVCIIINLGLGTLWLKISLNRGFFAMLPSRIIKEVIMLPIQVVMLKIMWQYIGGRILTHIGKNSPASKMVG